MNGVARIAIVLGLILMPMAARADLVSGQGWKIDVPHHCARSVVARKVPANPVYDAQATAELSRNPLMLLKPDYTNFPEHIYFDLSRCFGGESYWTALRIMPRDAFERILDVPGRTERDLADEFISLAQWIASGRELVRWPMLPFLDLATGVTAGVKRLGFSQGHGMRVLTIFTVDDFIARVDAFDYVFQGLSSGGGCYVLMSSRLRIPGLAGENSSDDRGFTDIELMNSADARRRYSLLVRKQIEDASIEITPKLAELDRLVESLTGSCAEDFSRPQGEPRL